jgi:geranylgeranyl diphosphate synthase type I
MPAGFSRQMDHAMGLAVRRLRALAPAGHPMDRLCAELDAFQRGGQRLRPRLFLLAYRGYGGRAWGAVPQAAAALELFHVFALIHDDILDGTLTRRSRPTLPVRMRQRFRPRGDGAILGRDLAMLAGDIVFSLAMEQFLSLEGPPERVMRAMRLILTSAVQTGCGAFQEVVVRSGQRRLSRAELLRLYDAKTSLYSFVCPLQVGAVLAGAPDGELALLGDLGQHLGRAYQIQDDLQDVVQWFRGGASKPMNLCETLLLYPVQTALRVLPGAAQTRLRRLCEAPAGNAGTLAEVEGLLRQAGAVRDAVDQIDGLLNDAWAACRRLGMPGDGAEHLARYARTRLNQRRKIPAALLE